MTGSWVWRRALPHVGSGVLLTSLSVVAISQGSPAAQQGTLAVLSGLWYVLGLPHADLLRRPLLDAGEIAKRWPLPLPPPTVWVTGLIALWAALTWVSPANVWLAITLWIIVGNLFEPRTSVPLAGVVLFVFAGASLAHSDPPRWAATIGALWTCAIIIGLSASQLTHLRENAQRERLIDRLLRSQVETQTLSEELALSQREAGVRAERARLSRDLHDTLAQSSAGIVLLARTARESTDPRRREELLTVIEQAARDDLAQTRQLVTALRPDDLALGSLPGAMRRLAERHRAETGVRPEVVVGDLPALPTEVEVALLRCSQSSLANVRRHAHAGAVALRLTADAHAVTLVVDDDGRGFDPGQVRRETVDGGYGLPAMRARVGELGGRLHVRSAPGEGTTLTVTLPLRLVLDVDTESGTGTGTTDTTKDVAGPA